MAQARGVFISYRRDDAAGQAGRLYDRMRDDFGARSVFMDVDSIEPGMDFTEAIDQALASCGVLLAVIGPRWLSERLADETDYVRLEIATALRRRVRVIPVLLDGATMPRGDDLPPDLGHLAHRQSFRLSHDRFRPDSDLLAAAVGRVLGARAEESPQWSVEVLMSQESARLLRLVSATGEAHLLEISVRWSILILLDGKVVRKSVLLRDRETAFPLGASAAVLSFHIRDTTVIHKLLLTVDGHPVYEE